MKKQAKKKRDKKQMNSEEPDETRKAPFAKYFYIQIDAGPSYTNPSPGMYLRKDIKGKGKSETRWSMVELRSMVNERAD